MEYQQLYEDILGRIDEKYVALPGLECVNEARAHKIAGYLFERRGILPQTCDLCDLTSEESKHARRGYTTEVYESPFDTEPRVAHFCCAEHRDTYLFEDPQWYEECYFCNRLIALTAPNGMMPYFRDYGDDRMCLACYEADILENGISREAFEECAEGDDSLPGMFFSGDNHEPLDAGYTYLHRDLCVRDQEGAKALCVAILSLIDKGCKAVVGYERLSIMGDEGYVSVFVKTPA